METVGLLGTGAQDVHLNFHTAPELWGVKEEQNRCHCASLEEGQPLVKEGQPLVKEGQPLVKEGQPLVNFNKKWSWTWKWSFGSGEVFISKFHGGMKS